MEALVFFSSSSSRSFSASRSLLNVVTLISKVVELVRSEAAPNNEFGDSLILIGSFSALPFYNSRPFFHWSGWDERREKGLGGRQKSELREEEGAHKVVSIC